MSNPFVKGWKYFMALFSHKLDEIADPKIQIQQALEESQSRHDKLVQQAAQVIGNQRQIEMKLNTAMDNLNKINANVRQSVMLADEAEKSGDNGKALEFNNAAEAFAAQLVTAEQAVEDLKIMHEQARGASEQAKQAVDQNEHALQKAIGDRNRMLTQLEQAKMQEHVSESLKSMSGIALESVNGTPTLEGVRDKIERRYANALGSAELSKNSVQGKMLEVERASVASAGSARLAQIRASMRGEPLVNTSIVSGKGTANTEQIGEAN